MFNENVKSQNLQETRKGHFWDKRKWRVLKKGTWGKILRFFLKLFGFGKRIKRWNAEADTLNLEDIAAEYPEKFDFSKIEILKKFLDAGSDPKTALIKAVDGDHNKAVEVIVKVLIANEADLNAALIMAAGRGQVIFDKLLKKIEDLKTGHKLNTQQIGKIVTTGMRIFNTMPIEFQNKFFKFFLSTLDDPNVISQLEGDILHCAKLFTIAETPSNQENTVEAEKELLQIKNINLRLGMVRRYAKTKGILGKILKNISIDQNKITQKIISYLELTRIFIQIILSFRENDTQNILKNGFLRFHH